MFLLSHDSLIRSGYSGISLPSKHSLELAISKGADKQCASRIISIKVVSEMVLYDNVLLNQINRRQLKNTVKVPHVLHKDF